MEIVIEIPDKVYIYVEREWEESEFDSVISHIFNGIKNGVVLPENHGALKDADVMINKLCTNEASELFGSTTCAEIMDFIDGEKPIIEADKGVLEKINEKQDSLKATYKAWDEAIEKNGYVN